MKFIICLLTALLMDAAIAGPAQIVLIRHAEKNAAGDQVDSQGCERAYLLPSFFQNNSVVNEYGSPAALYAERPDSRTKSLRAIETLAPTSAALSLPIHAGYVRKQYSQLAESLLKDHKYDGKTVIVAWEHGTIPSIAKALGYALTSDTKVWPNQVFDEAWVLNFANAQAPTLTILPEYVLPTDNPDGGKSWKKPPVSGGSGPAVPSQVATECLNNNSLNALLDNRVKPPLP